MHEAHGNYTVKMLYIKDGIMVVTFPCYNKENLLLLIQINTKTLSVKVIMYKDVDSKNPLVRA